MRKDGSEQNKLAIERNRSSSFEKESKRDTHERATRHASFITLARVGLSATNTPHPLIVPIAKTNARNARTFDFGNRFDNGDD